MDGWLDEWMDGETRGAKHERGRNMGGGGTTDGAAATAMSGPVERPRRGAMFAVRAAGSNDAFVACI